MDCPSYGRHQYIGTDLVNVMFIILVESRPLNTVQVQLDSLHVRHLKLGMLSCC